MTTRYPMGDVELVVAYAHVGLMRVCGMFGLKVESPA